MDKDDRPFAPGRGDGGTTFGARPKATSRLPSTLVAGADPFPDDGGRCELAAGVLHGARVAVLRGRRGNCRLVASGELPVASQAPSRDPFRRLFCGPICCLRAPRNNGFCVSPEIPAGSKLRQLYPQTW